MSLVILWHSILPCRSYCNHSLDETKFTFCSRYIRVYTCHMDFSILLTIASESNTACEFRASRRLFHFRGSKAQTDALKGHKAVTVQGSEPQEKRSHGLYTLLARENAHWPSKIKGLTLAAVAQNGNHKQARWAFGSGNNKDFAAS